MFVLMKESDEPFQRATDSNSPDNLYRSSDLGEPRLSGSLYYDKLIRFFRNHKHTAIITYISTGLKKPMQLSNSFIKSC